MVRETKYYKILRIVFYDNIFLLVRSGTKMRKVTTAGGINELYDKIKGFDFRPGWLVNKDDKFTIDDYMREYKVHVVALNTRNDVLLVSSIDEGVVYFDYFMYSKGRHSLLARFGKFRDMVDLRGRVMYDISDRIVHKVISSRFNEKLLLALASANRMVVVTWKTASNNIRMYEYVNGR